MKIEIDMTDKEKNLLFEKLARPALGSKTWDTSVGNVDANDITKAWEKLMIALYGAAWEKKAEQYKTL